MGSSHVFPSLLQSLKVWALLIEVGCEVHAGDGPHPTIGQSIDLLFSLPEVFAGLHAKRLADPIAWGVRKSFLADHDPMVRKRLHQKLHTYRIIPPSEKYHRQNVGF